MIRRLDASGRFELNCDGPGCPKRLDGADMPGLLQAATLGRWYVLTDPAGNEPRHLCPACAELYDDAVLLREHGFAVAWRPDDQDDELEPEQPEEPPAEQLAAAAPEPPPDPGAAQSRFAELRRQWDGFGFGKLGGGN